MLLIARNLAKVRKLKCKSLIGRKNNTKQRQASAKQRLEQAQNAFYIKGVINPDIPYLIVDDVYTTGATIKCASKLLSKAGAKHIWIAIIARQTLD